MRHRNSGKGLSRNSSHRKAMFRNMMNSLFKHEIIRTTLVKAKELRRFAEPILTRSKVDNIANRRLVASKLLDEQVVSKLFMVLGPRYSKRDGGYLRLIKCGWRPGDKSLMALVELVDRPSFEDKD